MLQLRIVPVPTTVATITTTTAAATSHKSLLATRNATWHAAKIASASTVAVFQPSPCHPTLSQLSRSALFLFSHIPLLLSCLPAVSYQTEIIVFQLINVNYDFERKNKVNLRATQCLPCVCAHLTATAFALLCSAGCHLK